MVREWFMRGGLRSREGNFDQKRGARAGLAHGGDGAVVEFHDLAANGEPNPRAFVFVAAMEPLENTEDALRVFGLEPNALIPHRDAVGFCGRLCGDRDPGRFVGVAELDRVADQVLQELPQLRAIPKDGRKGAWHVDLGIGLRDRNFEVFQHGGEDLIEVDFRAGCDCIDTRENASKSAISPCIR